LINLFSHSHAFKDSLEKNFPVSYSNEKIIPLSLLRTTEREIKRERERMNVFIVQHKTNPFAKNNTT
jgi:hypothetical protein